MGEHNQMDNLAYSSRMIALPPLGKLFIVISILIVNLVTTNVIIPMITLCLGLICIIYSTGMKFPKILVFLIAESLLIIVVGALCIMILPLAGDVSPVIWEWTPLGLRFVITHASIDYGLLILVRCLSGVSFMLAFATSTPIPHLAQSLRQLRIPVEIIEIVVLVYRYGFLLFEQLEIMWSAAHCRLGFGSFKKSFHTTAKIALNIFISSMEMTERSNIALCCRNFTGTFPLFNPPKRISLIWVIVPVIFAVALYYLGVYMPYSFSLSDLLFS